MIKLLCACFIAPLCAATQQPQWNHVRIEGDNGLKVEVSFIPQRENRSVVAPELWINVQGPNLSSESIVDVQLWTVQEGERKLSRFRDRIELLYNKRKNHFTWFTKTVVVRSEGTTGGDTSPRYLISVLLKEGEGKDTVLLIPTDLELKNAKP